MVKNIYFVNIPYSNFKQFKARPVLIFKELENDFLFLPLTSNLKRDGIVLNREDLVDGNLKKESVVVVPKITAIDKNIIFDSKFIGTVRESKFDKIIIKLCNSLGCIK